MYFIFIILTSIFIIGECRFIIGKSRRSHDYSHKKYIKIQNHLKTDCYCNGQEIMKYSDTNPQCLKLEPEVVAVINLDNPDIVSSIKNLCEIKERKLNYNKCLYDESEKI